MTWKNWGDHPIVVAIYIFGVLCGTIVLGYTVYDVHFKHENGAKSTDPSDNSDPPADLIPASQDWSYPKLSCSHSWNVQNSLLVSQLSRDGYTFAYIDIDGVRVWRLDDCREILVIPSGMGTIYDIAISDDGKILAISNSSTRNIDVWDLEDKRKINSLPGHSDLTLSLAINPNSNRLASGGKDRTIKLWDLETGQEILTLAEENFVYSLSFSPDGNSLVSRSGSEGSPHLVTTIWNLRTGEATSVCHRYPGIDGGCPYQIIGMASDANGQSVVVSEIYNSSKIKVWGLETGEEIRSFGGGFFDGETDDYRAVSVSEDGKYLATQASTSTQINLRDLESGKVLRTFGSSSDEDQRRFYYNFAFSSNDHILASSSKDQKLRLWNIESGSPISAISRSVFLSSHRNNVTLSFSHDSNLLITISPIDFQVFKP